MTIGWAEGNLLEEILQQMATDIKTHVTNERIATVAQINDDIARYIAAANHQFDQIREGLQGTIDGLQASLQQAQDSEMDAEARAAQFEAALTTANDNLQTMQNDMTTGSETLQAEATKLEADDQPPAEPAAQTQTKASARTTKK